MKTVLMILLCILKGIGWLLLILLALIIFILLILLFVPVRYRIDLSYEDENHDAHGKVTATWLLHLIRVDAVLQEKKLQTSYRILWIRKNLGQESDGQKKPKKKKSQEASKEKQTVDLLQNEEVLSQPEKETVPEKTEEQQLKDMILEEQQKPGEEEIPEEKKKSLLDKIREFPDLILTKWKELQNKIRGIFEKIYSIENKVDSTRVKIISQIDKVVNYPGRDALLQMFFGEIGYILGRFRPRSLTLMLKIGFDDPSTTGQCMAAYGVLTGWILSKIKKYTIQVEPDFENKCLAAELTAGGRIALYVILCTVIRLLKEKKIRKLIQDIRNR